MPLSLREQKMDVLKPKGNQILQMTFDEDVNVQDIKPDIDKILQTNSQIIVIKEEILQDKINIHGECKVNILYVPLNDKKPIHSMDVVIPFEESVNLDGITAKDSIKILSNVEDLSINLLNSRKINVKSIAGLSIEVHERKEVYITSDIDAGNEIEKKISSVSACQLKESMQTSYKIKDELAIPQGKPNIMEILWHETTIQNKEIKLIDGKINVKGTLHVATLYMAESAENLMEFVEHDVTFNGLIDCYGSRENMIHDVQMKIANENVTIRPDLDGEERVLAVEVDTRVDVKIYDEVQNHILADVYSLEKEIVLKKEPLHFQKLLCKNQSQSNLKESIFIEDDSKEILQIYYTSGECAIDNVDFLEDKINVEGVLFCKVMYVVADDHLPISVFEAPIPFEHQVDIKGLKPSSFVTISPQVNYISCTMIGAKEIEVKCAIMLNTLAFEDSVVDTIIGIEEKPIDMKAFQKIPGIVGYVVKDKDSLWDIAKKYRTKIQSIKKTNGLEDDHIARGDKLIIVKELLF